MKPQFECLRCLLSVRLREIENAKIDERKKLAVSKEIVELITREFNYDVELTRLASIIFNELLRRAPEVALYYDEIRRRSNIDALNNLRVHRDYIKSLDQESRFKYLLKLSVLGNIIDYGVADHKIPAGEITPELITRTDVTLDDSSKLYNYVKNGGKTILWLFDNAGEAVYDTLLINELRNMGNKVIGLVKDYPGFQNDITIREAMDIGLGAILDELHTYGCLCSTIHLDVIDNKVRELINKSDLIIAKGMSHFEYLSDIDLEKPVCFMLIPKCKPVARKLGLESPGFLVIHCRNLVDNI